MMSRLIQQFRGRVVDTPGDNLLAEFASVVDGVDCAVEIQRELAERNAALPAERRMEFRIGVNLGDVVEEEGRIYGDGVNIAARVESICEGGGVCISGTAYEHVAHKLDLEYDDLGEHEVKNISTSPSRVTSKDWCRPTYRRWIASSMESSSFLYFGSLQSSIPDCPG